MTSKRICLVLCMVVAGLLLGRLPGAAADVGSLSIRWAAIIDNGEGSTGGSKWNPKNWGKHGPLGNFHVLVYEPNMYDELRRHPGRTSYPRPLRQFVLRGPTHHEWDDGDIHVYGDPGVELFRWRSAQDAITVFIYESDPDRFLTRRQHDPIFLGVIARHETGRGRVYASGFAAHRDAVQRAEQRNGPALQRFLADTGAWRGPMRLGMPKMFLALQTAGGSGPLDIQVPPGDQAARGVAVGR
jgi:hypothetical protein